MNKTVLITGASRGIGKAIAFRFSREGFRTVLCARGEGELFRTRDQLLALGAACLAVTADVGKAEDCRRLFEEAQKAFGTVDILINNAGIFNFMKVVDMTAERLNLFVDLHVRSVTQLCRTFALDMLRRGCKGYIFNMASMCCWMPMPGIGAYAATKAYIRVLSRSMYLEMKDYGISVTVACPGGISTELFGLSPKLRKLAVRIGALTTPERFARNALRRVFNRRKQYVNGLLNRIAIVAVNNLPTCLCVQVKHRLLDKNITR